MHCAHDDVLEVQVGRSRSWTLSTFIYANTTTHNHTSNCQTFLVWKLGGYNSKVAVLRGRLKKCIWETTRHRHLTTGIYDVSTLVEELPWNYTYQHHYRPERSQFARHSNPAQRHSAWWTSIIQALCGMFAMQNTLAVTQGIRILTGPRIFRAQT